MHHYFQSDYECFLFQTNYFTSMGEHINLSLFFVCGDDDESFGSVHFHCSREHFSRIEALCNHHQITQGETFSDSIKVNFLQMYWSLNVFLSVVLQLEVFLTKLFNSCWQSKIENLFDFQIYYESIILNFCLDFVLQWQKPALFYSSEYFHCCNNIY